MPPCVIFEDEHLLVVNKPAGVNTHAPSPFAGEGIYDWLKHREPRWANLAIVHRLDKETSGVMVFGKTQLANRSLTAQFTERRVQKRYLLLTDGRAPRRELIVKSKIARAGERYRSSPDGEFAETRFTPAGTSAEAGVAVEAEPFTGRTHQIRIHAAEQGFPILGDTLYGGSPFARVCLHAVEIRFQHPAENREVNFNAPVDFAADPSTLLRLAFIDPSESDAWRAIHGASDGWPGWYLERLGNFVLSQSERELTEQQLTKIRDLRFAICDLRANRDAAAVDSSSQFPVYHKTLNRHVRRTATPQASPQLVSGTAAPERFLIRENGVAFELSFNEGYSVGLFLDQRDNRRRLLTGHVSAGFKLSYQQPAGGPHALRARPEVLNAFAYTCGFSVCAAKTGARTTSLDLSRKYLDWGKRNFEANGIDPAAHDFIYGDAFDWLRRFAKKQRKFDLIIFDPPTFSQSKETGVFRVEKDLAKLVEAAMPLLNPNGFLLASSNAAEWEPATFVEQITSAVQTSGRKISQQHYVPQPPDFPISREEPAYLKTIWLRIA